MAYQDWKISRISQHCMEETKRFRRNQRYNSDYCFELFRRAFQESEDQAFAYIWSNYRQLVGFWLRQHPFFNQLETLPFEFHLYDCFEQFVIGMSKHDFVQFASLPEILSFWKKCVNSVVMTAVRKKRLTEVPINQMVGLSMDGSEHMDSLIAAQMAWERIEMILTDEQDILLARLVIIQGLKPRHILAIYPHVWQTMRQLMTDIQRIIKRRLARDNELRKILGKEKVRID